MKRIDLYTFFGPPNDVWHNFIENHNQLSVDQINEYLKQYHNAKWSQHYLTFDDEIDLVGFILKWS